MIVPDMALMRLPAIIIIVALMEMGGVVNILILKGVLILLLQWIPINKTNINP